MTFFLLYLGECPKPRGKFVATFCFVERPKFCGKISLCSRKPFFMDNDWNFAENFQFLATEIFLLRTPARCVLRPWPRAFLSLACRGSILEKSVLSFRFFWVLRLGLERWIPDSTFGGKKPWCGTPKLCLVFLSFTFLNISVF